jgi:hypothetical protein
MLAKAQAAGHACTGFGDSAEVQLLRQQLADEQSKAEKLHADTTAKFSKLQTDNAQLTKTKGARASKEEAKALKDTVSESVQTAMKDAPTLQDIQDVVTRSIEAVDRKRKSEGSPSGEPPSKKKTNEESTNATLITNGHEVSMGLLALANNMATGNTQRVSVTAIDSQPCLTPDQMKLRASADAILKKWCAASGMCVELMCDDLMPPEEIAPELAKVTNLQEKRTVRRAAADEKELAAARATWSLRQGVMAGALGRA